MTESGSGNAAPSPELILDAVAAAYGLAGVRLVSKLGYWGRHLRWRLADAGGQHYLLKEPPCYLAGRDVDVPERVHLHVQSRGGPVAELMPTLSGRYRIAVAGRVMALQLFAPGRHLAVSDHAAIRRYGATIAHFADTASGARRWPAGDWSAPRVRLESDPDLPDGLARMVWLLGKPSLPFRPSRSTLSGLERIAAKSARAAGEVSSLSAGLRPQFVHGDPNPFNCLDPGPRGNQVLVDLDDARWGLPLWDLLQAAVLVGGIVRRNENAAASVRPDWDAEAVAALLEGYACVRPLTAGERHLFGPYLRLAALGVMVKAFELEVAGSRPPADLADQAQRLLELLSGPAPEI